MHMTGKQKRHLRRLGQAMEPSILVGKAGVTPAIVEALARQLSRRELVKVRMPPGAMPQRRATAETLARAAGATCPAILGRTALLYRPNEALPDEQRIALPP
jgi:RNA-binding protein